MNSEEYVIEHFTELQNRFMNLALNRFKWTNLPYGLNSRKIEEYLIKNGRVMFFKNENDGVLCLPASGTSGYNVYGEPTKYNVYGFNYTRVVDIEDGVIIRNNALGSDDWNDLNTFAQRINEIEMTMDLNLNVQKTPFMILCDEKERLTFKNMLNQVKKYKYAIFGSKTLSSKLENTKVLDLNAPYLLDKLQNQKRELMNELLTFLGINNANVDKKERLLVDEVNGNNDFILVNLQHMYEERKLACDEINKKFGLNIQVEKREVDFLGELQNDKIEEGEEG